MLFPLLHCSNTPVLLMVNFRVSLGGNSKPGLWTLILYFDNLLQRFFDFRYLMVKGLLTPEESENIYKNNCPGYAEGRKKIDTIVHYKFLSLYSCRP